MGHLETKRTGRHYQLAETIERADAWRVFAGHEESSGSQVLVTVVPLADEAAVEALIAEARALRNFNHPGIADLLDITPCPGGAVLIHRDPGGVNLGEVMASAGGRLAGGLALSLARDCAEILAAMAAADLGHGGLQLNWIRLTAKKTVILAHPLPPSLDDLCPPRHRDLAALQHTAPERLDPHPPGFEPSADVYALGSCLVQMLSGRPLFEGPDPEALIAAITAEERPDLAAWLPAAGRELHQVLDCCLARYPSERYRDPAELVHDLTVIIEVRQGDGRGAGSDRLRTVGKGNRLASRSDLFATDDVQAHQRQAEKATEAVAPKIQDDALKAMMRFMMVAGDEMLAWIVLAPGSRFPRQVLEAVLSHGGITHGWREPGLLEASSPSNSPRKIVLAEGTPPRPGVPGTTVRGAPVEALRNPVLIVVSDDRMKAIAHTPPSELVPQAKVEEALAEAGIQHGLDQEALARLWTTGSESGQTLIARGTPIEPPQLAFFRLRDDPATEDVTPSAGNDLAGTMAIKRRVRDSLAVQRGNKFAIWEPQEPGVAGVDVFGDELPPPAIEVRDPIDYAGEGTSITRFKERIFLVAERHGAVQVQRGGLIRVLPQRELHGDIGPDQSPLEADDLIVVHGNILDGAIVNASTDLKVFGDIGDARVEVGGRLEVAGRILPGEAEVVVAGALAAGSISERKVVCGKLDVAGGLTGGEVVVTGPARVDRVSAGTLIASGDIAVREAGDDQGSETLLWAGHHVPNAIQRDMAKLDQRRLYAERGRMLEERNRFVEYLQTLKRKNYMYSVVGYMAKEAMQDMRQRLEGMARRTRSLEGEMEEVRQVFLDRQDEVEQIQPETDNRAAVITVDDIARAGVILRLADTEGRTLTTDQEGVRCAL